MAFDGVDAQKLTVNALYYLIANPGTNGGFANGSLPHGAGESKLKICKLMDRRLQVWIPTKNKHGKPIRNANHYVKKSRKLFAESFGGCNCKNYFGFYRNRQARIMGEPVFELEAWMTESELLAHLGEIEGFIVCLLEKLEQECVMVAIGDRAALFEL